MKPENIVHIDKNRNNYFCGCGNVPVKYFIERDDGTFYWCGVCIDFETMDMVLRCLGLYPDFEIGIYDGPPISSADGRNIPLDEQSGLCKHWNTSGPTGLCNAPEMRGRSNPEETESCEGLLMNCKNPKYMIKEEKPMTEEMLSDLVKRTIEITKEIIDNRDPPRPFDKVAKSYESLKEAEEAKIMLDAWEKTKADNQKRREVLQDEQKQIHSKIIEILPFRNTWIKVVVKKDNKTEVLQDIEYAVGYYNCDHGGNHNVVDIMTWDKDLPELKDRQSS